MLKDLVQRYPDVFTDVPGETDVIQHKIKLTDDTPIRCKPYPLPYAMREELWKDWKVCWRWEWLDRRHRHTRRLLSQ